MSKEIQLSGSQGLSNNTGSHDNEEILEIEDTPDIPSARKTHNSKKKENLENSSSEATTPNKKKRKSNTKNLGSIEIMDTSKLKAFNTLMNKNNKSIANTNGNNDKLKKCENISYKSYSIFNFGSDKKTNLIKGKNPSKIASVTLDESDEENDIPDNSEINFNFPINKNNSKTPQKKFNKNFEKINTIKHEIMQCELLSSLECENENEKNSQNKKIKDSIFIHQKQKQTKSNDRIFPSELLSSNGKNNTIYSNNQKNHKKIIKNNDINEKKSKSTIKASIKTIAINEKINSLLGRKRMPYDADDMDTENKKSKTPNKIINKSKLFRKMQSVQSMTPDNKKIEQTNNIIDILLNPIIENEKNEKQNTRKNYPNYNSEFALVNQLVEEYGLEKVLDCLCKDKLDQKNKLDACLQSLIVNTYNGHGKLPYLLLKILFNYIKSIDNNNNNKEAEIKIASPVKTKSLKSPNKQPLFINETKSVFSYKDYHHKGVKNSNSNSNFTEKRNKRNSVLDKGKEKNNKRIKKSNKKNEERKNMSIGSHYYKTKDGKIYKYQVSSLDEKGNAIFKCYDDKCDSMGIYELASMKFLVTKEHNLNHSEHDYIINYDEETDNTFKDLIETDKSNAQAFKVNGERTVKIY